MDRFYIQTAQYANGPYDLKTRKELLAAYLPKYVEDEEPKCFFRLGDIVKLGGVITQVNAICTGGYAYANGSSEQLRTSDDAELLWRAV